MKLLRAIFLLFLLAAPGGAEAWVHGSSGFNGGKTQIGVNFLQIGNDYAFLNALKGGQAWSNFTGNGAPDPSILNSDGYPTSIASGGVYTVFYIPTQSERSGNYAVKWTGNGTVSFNATNNTALSTATFTGSVTSGVLTAGAPSGGTIQKGMILSTGGIVGNQTSGSAGQAGTYLLVNGVNAGSQSMSVSAGSLTTSSGSGRYVFSTTDFRIAFGITALGSPIISNLQFFHVDDEAALDAGEVFGARFKQVLAAANNGVIRFLDWQSGNQSNVTNWASRKPVSYVYYAGQEYRSSLYPTTSVTNSGNDYSVAAPPGWGGLVDGTMVQVRFNVSQSATPATVTITCSVGNPVVVNWSGNTLSVGDPVGFQTGNTLPGPLFPGGNFFVSATGFSSGVSFQVAATSGGSSLNCTNSSQSGTQQAGRQPTLNVGSTGAVAVKNFYGNTLTSGSNTTINSGTIATLLYDAKLNSWIKFGADTASGSQGINNAVPPELMVRLATELRAHPYVVTPCWTIDNASDYMPSLATYFRDNSPSWMIPRYEGPNENWNNAAAFYCTRLAWNRAYAWWGAWQDNNNWYGKVESNLGQIISHIYGGNRSKYWVIAGVQSSTYASASGSNPRLNSNSYVSTGPVEPALSGPWGTINFTQTAAYNWATHVAVTNYTNPTEQKTLDELRHGYDYVVTQAGNPSAQATLAENYALTLVGSNAGLKISYAAWKAWAQGPWGGSINLGLTAYEGGYSPDYTNTNTNNPVNWSSTVSGATPGNPCVLVLDTTLTPSSSPTQSGNPAVAGMTMTISGLGGSLGTLLNGNTYTVQSGVSGNNVPINVDCTSASYTTAGSASWVNSALYVNTLRYASKFAPSLTSLTTTNLQNFLDEGGLFPSQFFLSGSSTGVDRNVAIGASPAQVWGAYDPSIWSTPSTAWDAFAPFNANWLLKRDLEPASNDNDPMFLEKAA